MLQHRKMATLMITIAKLLYPPDGHLLLQNLLKIVQLANKIKHTGLKVLVNNMALLTIGEFWMLLLRLLFAVFAICCLIFLVLGFMASDAVLFVIAYLQLQAFNCTGSQTAFP
jgi:hypothetical protein